MSRRKPERPDEHVPPPVSRDEGGLLFREYGTVFDTWAMRFTQRLIGGLIVRQDRGGLRVASVELNSIEDGVVVVIEHYGNSEFVQSRVGHRLILSRLRAVAVDDDPGSAMNMYFDDVVAPIMPGEAEPVDGVHWVTHPPTPAG
ncbi:MULTISPECIES: hypothetical protein [Nocardia]|jgi:hypothetical protein|uniref:Uncharacterized protein n=1 Tax=Nocardia fluminea TaxID=134984 RepID=A0A2N3VHP2_9NOCA|nr:MULTISPECIES: hypothetical protein [Nocardia]PKV81119.1 hypothetical protein ATK86_5575 [Nocardia fluminea]